MIVKNKFNKKTNSLIETGEEARWKFRFRIMKISSYASDDSRDGGGDDNTYNTITTVYNII